jgi:hypothetical protein
MSIPFTQYLMPDGRKREATFESDEETEKIASKLIKRGYWFDVEVLSTGLISMTCETLVDGDPEPIAHEICKNGPEVFEAVKRLVGTAKEHMDAEQ